MRTNLVIAGVLLAAGTVAAQPTLTSLGSGTPISVTNSLGGTYYIGGGSGTSTGAARWSLTGGLLTLQEIGGNGGGQISKNDGAYIATGILNGPTRFAIGNTATGVTPAFTPLPTLTASATQPAATEFGGSRWSASSNTFTNFGALPIIPFTPNSGPKTISTITCAGDVATATTTVAHGLLVGDRVVVTGGSTVTYNKLATVTAVPSTTTFEYAATCAVDSTGGTATKFEPGTSGVFGSSSSGGSTSDFISVRNISADGRFVVAMAYACVYNAGSTAGTSISANSFYWRPVIWDAQGNMGAGSLSVLPTPFRTGTGAGANTRRRTGNPYAVSTDGLVVVGATEHNVGSANAPDGDGGRLVVWRRATESDPFEFSYLDTGVDANGYPNSVSSTPSGVVMNSAGTIIVARGPLGISKWVWDGSSWGAPIIIGSNLATRAVITTTSCSGGIMTINTDGAHGLTVGENVNISGNLPSGTLPFGSSGFNGYYTVSATPTATSFECLVNTCPVDNSNNPITGSAGTVNDAGSWIPGSVRSCGQPPNIGGILAMSEDGNTIGGSATYSTCGSFMQAGFIWHASDNKIKDWYDYNRALGTAGCTTGGFYGPIGDAGDPSRGLPALGNPIGISPDANAIVGRQGGNQIIVGAVPWVWQATGGAPCTPPAIALNPAATTNYTACTSQIILNVSASGTAPFAFQWYKNGNPLVDGTTMTGSVITGATSFQLRVSPPFTAADAGTYYAVVTGQCGAPAQTTNAVVQIDPAFATPPANDVCSTAQVVTTGTNVLAPAQNLCGAFVMDPAGSNCGSIKTDRWFSFTPAATGTYRLETCGSNFDTVLGVFDACGGSEIACNNDYTIGASTGCSAQRSRIDIELTAATVYYIRIAAPAAAFISTSSTMNLSINPAPARAANDDCDDASVAVLGANVFSTNEATNDWVPICAPVQSRDVWFRYNPTVRGFLKATTCGVSGTFDTVLSITESCYSANENGCNDDTNVSPCFTQSTIDNLPVVPGTNYYIRVGGAGSPPAFAFGNGTLTLTLRCKSDFNGVGGVSVQDIYDFLADWNSQVTGGPVILFSADYNSDGVVSVQDIYDFLGDWNTCSVL